MCNSKICKKCSLEKNISNFGRNTSKKGGYDIYCKECIKEKSKKFREQEKVIPEFKTCSECGLLKTSNEFNKTSSHRDGLTHKCKVCFSVYSKQWYDNNKELSSQKCKNRRKRLKDYDIESLRASEKIQREKSKKYAEEYRKTYGTERRKTDTIFRISTNLRNRIKSSFNRTIHNKQSKTVEILGCTFKEFKNYIETQFEPWMTWDNYGNCDTGDYNCSWHLDHIIPVGLAKTEEEVYLLNHWSNFQPLCSKKNLEKNVYVPDTENIIIGIKVKDGIILKI